MNTIFFTIFSASVLIYTSLFSVVAAATPPTAEPIKNIVFVGGTLQEAQQQARREGKILFVEIYATWCMPCKFLEQNVFSNPEIAAFYNHYFVNYKLNFDSIEGEVFKQEHQVQYLPELFFFDASGNIVLRETGDLSTQSFLQMGKQAAGNPPMPPLGDMWAAGGDDDIVYSSAPSSSAQKHYPEANTSKQVNAAASQANSIEQRQLSELHTLAYQLKEKGEFDTFVADAYLKKIGKSKSKLHSAQVMNFIYAFSEDAPSRATELLIQYHEWFEPHYGSLHIDTRIKNALRLGVQRAAANQQPDNFEKCLRLAKKSKLKDKKEVATELKMLYYQEMSDVKLYVKAANEYFKKSKRPQADILKNAARFVADNSNDKCELTQAYRWAKKAFSLQRNDYELQALLNEINRKI